VHCLVNNGEMQKDRARHARHENPALPSRGRESGYDCHALLLTTSTSAEALSGTRLNPLPSPPLPCPSLAGAARLLRGGAPRRFLTTASPDPREVRRGHSSFPLARGLQCCIRGRHRPRAMSLCARSAWNGEPRQAGPGRRVGACLSARGRGGESRSPLATLR
jgi:hypothetical protein